MRCRISRSRERCSARTALLIFGLHGHKAHVRSCHRSEIASASARIILLALHVGAFTYAGGISRTSWPRAAISRAQKCEVGGGGTLPPCPDPGRGGSSLERKSSTAPRRSFFCQDDGADDIKAVKPEKRTWPGQSLSVVICMWSAPSFVGCHKAPTWHNAMPSGWSRPHHSDECEPVSARTGTLSLIPRRRPRHSARAAARFLLEEAFGRERNCDRG